MARRRSPEDALIQALGHEFARPELFERALTHPSAIPTGGAARRGYERLEFLGDRVLGLIVADMLMTRFPRESEGQLARRHAHLVRRQSLVSVARAIGLGAALRLSPGEAGAGARESPALLGDSLEAVIAALYRDGGIEVARAFVERYWKPLMAAEETPPRDAKTALQEWAQGGGRPLPRYRILSAEGPAHEPWFVVEARVEGALPGTGSGRSKRVAEQAAAAAVLDGIDDGAGAGADG